MLHAWSNLPQCSNYPTLKHPQCGSLAKSLHSCQTTQRLDPSLPRHQFIDSDLPCYSIMVDGEYAAKHSRSCMEFVLLLKGVGVHEHHNYFNPRKRSLYSCESIFPGNGPHDKANQIISLQKIFSCYQLVPPESAVSVLHSVSTAMHNTIITLLTYPLHFHSLHPALHNP